MKRILFLLVALLFTAVCNASPPEEVKVFEPDKTFVAQANDLVSCTFTNTAIVEQHAVDAAVKADKYTIRNFGSAEQSMVKEVAYPLKISVHELNLNEQKVIGLIPKITFTAQAFLKPPVPDKHLLTNCIQRNNHLLNFQNSNFGYPFSAD